jgi:hypothetical protein
MVTITNDKIEQAIVCAARYRLLALSDSNPLMIRLLEQNALWLEGMVARLKHSSNLFNDAPA